MKKLIAIFLVAIMLLSVLASCGSGETDTGNKDKGDYTGGDNGGNGNNNGGNNDQPLVLDTIPEGMTGREVASLILASQRLNSQLLKNSEHIFDEGSATLTSLSVMAKESLADYTFYAGANASVTPLSSTKYQNPDGSTVEKTGNTFRWGNFAEYSNSYDYFLNLTNGISSCAENGAKLIDNVKKYVRVVDKWVNIHGTEYFLHVEENCEILYERHEDFTQMCMRTKTEGGENRYDLYSFSENGQTRMVYVAGKICEYSHVMNNEFNHNFLAENNKGYWEVVDVGIQSEGRHHVTCMALKDDISYMATYVPFERREVNRIDVISADRKTDLISFLDLGSANIVDIYLQGFSGYKYIEGEFEPDVIFPWGTESENVEMVYDDEYYEDRVIYLPYNSQKLSVVLDNGRSLKVGDTFMDGKLILNDIRVSHNTKETGSGADAAGHYTDGYSATLSIGVEADSASEIWTLLEAFLRDSGLKSNRDMEYVKNGLVRARTELDQFVKYHEWSESPIYTTEDIEAGWANNLAKFAAYKADYDKIKDIEVLDFSDKELIEFNIKFAPIVSASSESIKNDGMTVSVKDLALTVDDTLLFVTGEEYTVNFALAPVGNNDASGLTHIEMTDPVKTVFQGGKSFTLKQSASFKLPVLSEGEYTLVAYISTFDGIRSSAYTGVVFTELSPTESREDNISCSLEKNDKNELKMTCAVIRDIEITVEGEQSYTSMYDALAKVAHSYGTLDENAVLELLGEDESWTAVVEGTEPLGSGTYRLKYSILLKDSTVEGSVYVSYTAPEPPAEPEVPNDPDVPEDPESSDTPDNTEGGAQMNT